MDSFLHSALQRNQFKRTGNSRRFNIAGPGAMLSALIGGGDIQVYVRVCVCVKGGGALCVCVSVKVN